MIVSFRHKALRAYYEKGKTKGLNADWLPPIQRVLSVLDAASSPAEMDVPGFHLHQLKGELAGYWSVRVTGNWRIIWTFEGEDAADVDLIDYH